MTKQWHASHPVFDPKGSMTVLLLLAFGTAAIAVLVAWGESSSALFSNPRGVNGTTMELEPSALLAQGLEP
jgi:hypothetical protein